MSELDELRASVNAMRAALGTIRGFDDPWSHRGHEPSEVGHECRMCWIMKMAHAALASTPAAILADHDEKVRAAEREACARVAVKALRVRERMSSQDDGFGSSEAMVAAAIRARSRLAMPSSRRGSDEQEVR